MKKLTQRRRAWLLNRIRRQTNEKARRKAPFKTAMVFDSGGYGRMYVSKPLADMPQTFCFDRNYSEVAEFLDRLRRRFCVRTEGTRRYARASAGRVKWLGRYVRFETVSEISPSAALVLAAEYDRARRRAGSPLRLINLDRWDPSVIHALEQVGFFELLQIPVPPLVAPPTGLRILRMRSGRLLDSTGVGALKSELMELAGPLSSHIPDLALYRAVIEATLNVHQHAYPKGATWRFPPSHRWYMTAAADIARGRITVVVYDQGISIPKHLPHSKWRFITEWTGRLRAILGRDPTPDDSQFDGEAIAAAMEVAVTSTGMAGRGKGLADIRQFVETCGTGHLRILSRCGEFLYSPGATIVSRTHDVSIGGTLVEWEIVLPQSGASNGN